ncbi:hypothetical protein VTK73DRAFT_3980 [Phialemonium thermophilum]|uniref:Uncharacterized protein n=1 Tax=Phialemonium thermophilum TaxID=223376 RepID=A0ABR3VCU2_9PEZI
MVAVGPGRTGLSACRAGVRKPLRLSTPWRTRWVPRVSCPRPWTRNARRRHGFSEPFAKRASTATQPPRSRVSPPPPPPPPLRRSPSPSRASS